MLFIDVAPTAYFHLPCNYVSPTLLPACVGHGALLRTPVAEAPGRLLRESGRSCHCFIRADPSPGVSDFSDGAGGAEIRLTSGAGLGSGAVGAASMSPSLGLEPDFLQVPLQQP